VDATEKKLTIAQQTKKGTVYIVSNVGAFGDGIYKIGQTRRPNKQERIDELGDASVPFDFDVHAWIQSDNAPALEHKLQRRFLATQINKINSRKEFFRVTLKEIREELDRLTQTDPLTIVHWTDTAAAAQYRETLDISKAIRRSYKSGSRVRRLLQNARCDSMSFA
ncbi:MAG: GIY-YIG nuclease family protein, partial [Deltaproteobacteria bacterium]|nr:GIY-YIG nuclease family protein [Deltaproteobacteria bacterium]